MHDQAVFSDLARQYRDALLTDVIPFWQRHSIDDACGGYFTCLDRVGASYDEKKYVMMQARQVWLFSALVNRLERRPDWLETARHGAAFLAAHGRDAAGNWYTGLDSAGQPLAQPRDLVCDCFVAMALGQFALAAGDDVARELALATYGHILRNWDGPPGQNREAAAGAPASPTLTLPAILANATLELDGVLDAATVADTLGACLRHVMGIHLDRERLLLHEGAASGGGPITVGLGVEAMWIMMDIARRRGDGHLLGTCVDVALNTVTAGWDDAYGGLYSSVDTSGAPPSRPGSDQKVWWVHAEALIALAMGYERTGRDDCLRWFRRVHDYTWAHFPDPAYGEWYSALDRRGDVLQSYKGGRWKGCFHVPRALWMCWQTFERLAQQTAGGA